MSRLALAVGFMSLLGCLNPAPEHPGPPGPRQLHIALAPRVYHLTNGLTAILVPDRDADLASLRVAVRVGAIDDPPDRPGLAHLAAHLSYATLTGRLTRWDQLDRITTGINTTPEATETTFVAQFDAGHLADVLRIEAQRLSVHCGAGTPHWFSWQRGQVADELRASANWIVNRDFHHALYPAGDPLYRAYDATPDTVTAATENETCAFLDRYYVPANTTVVVSGPIDPAAFERTIKAELEPVPAGQRNARPPRPAPAAAGTDATITADVNEPSLAITYPLPDAAGERAVMTFALELLALKVDAASIHIDDDVAMVWFPEHLADATTALDKIKAAVQTGLVEPKEFEATRTRRVTELLGRLDSEPTRLALISDSVDLDAPFTALDQVSPQGFEQFVAAHLDLAHARIFRMQPSGTRAKWRAAALGSPGHSLVGPSSFILDGWPAFTGTTSGALSRARTVKLANGMTAVLVPTSPIPIVEFRLAFNVGAAAEPEAHPGTAGLAVGAIEQMALRAHPDTSWAIGTHSSGADLDTSGVTLRGPSLDADLLLGQLDGLAHEPFETADLQKASDEMTKGAGAYSAMQHVLDQGATMRATTFGADHPYGRAKTPTPKDIAAFDAKEVAAFAQKYLQPNNATLIVTGGFDPDAVEPIIHQTFDAWTGHGDAAPAQPVHTTAAAYAADEKRATVALHISWQGAPMDDHYEARYLLANMLGILSPDVRGNYAQRRQGGTYELNATFDPATAPQQIAAVLAAIPKVGSGDAGYTFAFQSARMRQARWLGGVQGSVSTWANYILFGRVNGRDTAWLADLGKRAAAVTYADVAELARTELTLDRANISIRGPHDAVAAVYAALGMTPTWL